MSHFTFVPGNLLIFKLQRFPWKKADDDNDNDVGTADKVEEEAEDKMKQDKYYKKLVKTIDDKELDEDLVKVI